MNTNGNFNLACTVIPVWREHYSMYVRTYVCMCVTMYVSNVRK